MISGESDHDARDECTCSLFQNKNGSRTFVLLLSFGGMVLAGAQALDPEDLRNLARQLQGKRLSDGERLDLARTFLSSVHLTCQQVRTWAPTRNG